MKKSILCFILFVIITNSIFANRELLSNPIKINRFYNLEIMLWKDKLTLEDEDLLKEITANSRSGLVLTQVIKVISVHRRDDFIILLDKAESKKWEIWKYIKPILQEKKNDLFLEQLSDYVPSNYDDSLIEGEPTAERSIISLLVIEYCRKLRRKENFPVVLIEKLPLSNKDKLLIEYSKLSQEKAIEEIIKIIKSSDKIEINSIPIILSSYSQYIIPEILNLLKNNQSLIKDAVYMSINNLNSFYSMMTDTEQYLFYNLINKIQVQYKKDELMQIYVTNIQKNIKLMKEEKLKKEQKH